MKSRIKSSICQEKAPINRATLPSLSDDERKVFENQLKEIEGEGNAEISAAFTTFVEEMEKAKKDVPKAYEIRLIKLPIVIMWILIHG